MGCLRLVDIEKSFEGKPVLERLTLTVEQGESLVILGGSGTGKSVLLSIMTGLMAPDEGRAYLWGEDVTRWDDASWVPLRKRIGMLFQGGALFDSLNVYDNVAFPIRAHRDWPEDAIRKIVGQRLAAVGLPGTEQLFPRELSGGMMKRIALARALALEPDLIFYDEPTTGLDPLTSNRITRLIRDLHRKLGGTIVTVTHDMKCAFHVADRIAYLEAGQIVEVGTPEEIRRTSIDSLREFIEGGT